MRTRYPYGPLVTALCAGLCFGQVPSEGITEASPSRSHYFSWINDTNEGADEAQTLVNLAFFRWLADTYGMQLDLYALDAGAIDGKRYYGSMSSERFHRRWPSAFSEVSRVAGEMGTRLGLWAGPDGFGDDAASQAKRTEMLVDLCRDHDFALFKFDAVAGGLRRSHRRAFIDLVARCREHVEDLIVLNHRVALGDEGQDVATTWLWEGRETYIDVHMANRVTAPHHRAEALARGLPPKLSRLTEDHGVCLSSALDHWEDELVLQAFNRSLILAPQIYGNPWFLADDEYPRLARIFNLHRQHRQLLVSGVRLPEEHYGPHAVSRGDGETRLITLRNLSWEPLRYRLRLDAELGLRAGAGPFEVRRFHPTEEVLATLPFGGELQVAVEPFRCALLRVSTKSGLPLLGGAYELLRERADGHRELLVHGSPGTTRLLRLADGSPESTVVVDGEAALRRKAGEPIAVHFPGTPLKAATHRRLGAMQPAPLPSDAQALYEATVFAADNDALELRSLRRSGPTRIPAVRAAREAFLKDPIFRSRAVDSRQLFDGDPQTGFAVMHRWATSWNPDFDPRVRGGGFRIDFGSAQAVDAIVLETRDDASLQPAKRDEGLVAEVSTDLRHWQRLVTLAGPRMVFRLPQPGTPVRYFRILEDAPAWLSEASALHQGRTLDRSAWRASNLFGAYGRMGFDRAWTLDTRLEEIAPGAFLAVAMPGPTGREGAYAALRVGERLVGAPDRAPSYPSNTWEFQTARPSGNLTVYIPLDPTWIDMPLQVVVLGSETAAALQPEVWLTRRPTPLATRTLSIAPSERSKRDR